MYEEFYNFTEKPFHIVPDPNYLYLSPKHEEALNLIEYGLMENAGLIMLSGEIGCGKTTLVNHILRQIDPNMAVANIFNTSLNADQLISFIVQEFNLEPHDTDKAKNIRILNDFLIDRYRQQKRTLIVIDEAQNLPIDALEEIRMLTNLQIDDWSLVQVMLVGQPELRARLSEPRYAQIAQRIAVNFHLSALSKAETGKYISHRLQVAEGRPDIFTPNAKNLIFSAAAGIPRSINLVCDSALIFGFADELQTIKAETVERGIQELNIMGLIKSINTPKKETPKSSTSPARLDGDEIALRLQIIEAGMRLLQKQNKQLAQYVNVVFNKKLLAGLKEIVSFEYKLSEKLFKKIDDIKDQIDALQNGTDPVDFKLPEIKLPDEATDVDENDKQEVFKKVIRPID
jgi:type II secretory pathway predicted ATPase ExeA